jgi:Ca2+-binding EF-hand superfamily protein
LFDLDGDGTITRNELKTIMDALSGESVPQDVIDYVHKEADSDGDGKPAYRSLPIL